jgi:glutathione S-transferase
MIDFAMYHSALLAIWVIVATVIVQGLVAAAVKAKQPNAIPGKMPDDLDHHSIVFRTTRTHQNSLENLAVMLGTAFTAILVGAQPQWTANWIWLFAFARIVHMVLYYLIATNKNPSPRSYFYLLGLFANIALLVLILISLL